MEERDSGGRLQQVPTLPHPPRFLFESVPDKSRILKTEQTAFWGGQCLAITMWSFFAVYALITVITSPTKFMWLGLSIVVLVLVCTNTIGYIKCRGKANKALFSSAKGKLFFGSFQTLPS